MSESMQLALINGNALTEQDVLSAVDSVVTNLYESGDINRATDALIKLEKIEQVSGHAKARLLYGMYKWWLTTQDGKSFRDFIESRTTLNSTVVDRYIVVQECIESGQIPEDVSVRPMRELIPIAKTLSQGHEITQAGWNKIVKATGLSEIGDIIRGIKNRKPKKGSAQIYWERDGSVVLWKNNKRKNLGWLDKEAFEEDVDIKAAINKILDNAGVIRK